MKLCTLDLIHDVEDKVKKTWVSKMILPNNQCIDYRMHINRRRVFQGRPGHFKDILERKC